MKTIVDKKLLDQFINKYGIECMLGREILEHALLHFYRKEEFILEAQAELSYYYLLVDGKIKVSYLFENGKSMLLKFYHAFNTVGDLELLKKTPVLCNVEAAEDSYLIAIPADILRNQHAGNIKLLHHLVDSLSEKLYGTINNSSYNYVYPLANRLSSYLVEHLFDKDDITLNASFDEIAQFLGTTYRHLNRTIRELEAKSILRCENKTVYIIDENKLRELAKNLYVKPL